MPQRLDTERVRALCARLGLEVDELSLQRTLRFDPRSHCVLIATVLVGRTEEVAGLAVMNRDAPDPDLVLCDEHLAQGVRAHLEAAMARSAAWPQRSSRAWSR